MGTRVALRVLESCLVIKGIVAPVSKIARALRHCSSEKTKVNTVRPNDKIFPLTCLKPGRTRLTLPAAPSASDVGDML